MFRQPIVAGLSYEKDKIKLIRQIESLFTSSLGPGDLPVQSKKGIVHAAILPHGPYQHSGACAAWGFKEIAEAEQPDCFLILAVSHREPITCLSINNFVTPLGTVENDDELRSFLLTFGMKKNDDAHSKEYAIEAQLPFLQHLFRTGGRLRFVPVLVGNEESSEIARILKQAIDAYQATGKRVCIIVSSDMTHYGNRYGYTPFLFSAKDEMAKMDAKALHYITSMDAEGFLSYCLEINSTICGRQAIAVLLEYLELTQQVVKIDVLRYYTSADLTGDYQRGSVGYASVVVR